MPVAPADRAAAMSAGSSMLASRAMAVPSAVTAGEALRLASCPPARTLGVVLLFASSRTSAGGSTRTTPLVPSIATVTPGWMRALIEPSPTTAGTCSDRARMAVWWVGLPPSLA